MTERFAPHRVMVESERQFQDRIIQVAQLYGWKLIYHPPDNVPVTARSGARYVQNIKAGWPDLVLCRPPEILFWEIKTEKGKVKPEQEQWIDALHRCGLEVRIIRPSDFAWVQERLRRRRHAE